METVSRSAIFNRFESVAKKKSSLACPPACLGELTGKGGQGGEAGTPRDSHMGHRDTLKCGTVARVRLVHSHLRRMYKGAWIEALEQKQRVGH